MNGVQLPYRLKIMGYNNPDARWMRFVASSCMERHNFKIKQAEPGLNFQRIQAFSSKVSGINPARY